MSKTASLLNGFGFPFPGETVVRVEFSVVNSPEADSVSFDFATVFYSSGGHVLSHMDATAPSDLCRQAGRFVPRPSNHFTKYPRWSFVLELGEEAMSGSQRKAWGELKNQIDKESLLQEWFGPGPQAFAQVGGT